MWQIVWEFRVPEEQRPHFERSYGPQGEWVELFSRSSEFLGTILLRDPVVAGRYLTIDTWSQADAFPRFEEKYEAEYQDLDRHCEPLTEYEIKIGAFETVA
jgi:hypothetical protein